MYKKYIKQFLDILVAIVLFIFLLPLMIIVAFILIIDLGFPLWNKLRFREGKNRVPFIMYKFRTKKLGMEYVNDGSQFTRISAIIDRLRLNELPQLINVIKGDMSLVGPRPFIPNDKLPFGKISNKRYMLKPGITGLAQINGGRRLTHEEKLEYDFIYYDNLSFINDFKIIIKTPFSILSKKTL